MSNHISDLGGLGEIFRQLRLAVMGTLRYRSARTFRALRDEAQGLENEEQRLKNQERRLKYTKDLLALAKTYDRWPEDLQGMVDSITDNGNYEPKAKLSPGIELKLLARPNRADLE